MYNNDTINCKKNTKGGKYMDDHAKNEILAAIENVNVKIDIMQEQVSKIPEMQKEIAKIPSLQQDIKEMQQDIRNISKSVAIIEHEYGDKLKALFDAFTANTEKIETQEEKISFCEKKLENHNIEIDYLTNKVQGL